MASVFEASQMAVGKASMQVELACTLVEHLALPLLGFLLLHLVRLQLSLQEPNPFVCFFELLTCIVKLLVKLSSIIDFFRLRLEHRQVIRIFGAFAAGALLTASCAERCLQE